MFRRFLVVASLAVVAALAADRPAAAGPVSPNNPYRSFNISGVNYGSMRWEQTHGNRGGARHAWTPRRFGGFRRR